MNPPEKQRSHNTVPIDWYYSNNGQQAGPVSETQLQELERTGGITAATLVWRNGLADWQPYRAAHPTATVAPPPMPPSGSAPPVLEQAVCVECRRVFVTGELLRYENVFVCAGCKPGFFQKLREGLTPGGHSLLWRSGKFLVLRKDSVLPNRCVKCNADAPDKKLTRKLFWHPPLLYLLILTGLLPYAIVATVVGKRARIQIGLCREHREKRRRDMVIAWLLFFLSIGAFIAAGYFENGWLVVVGVVCLLAGPIYGTITCTPVSPKRIDNQFVWLNGVSPKFLDQLGEFPEQR